MSVTWLVSISGTVISDGQSRNISRMVVALLESISNGISVTVR